MPWFRPSCQLDAEGKSWIDGRFSWLSQEFGLESIWEAEVVLPTHEYFPDPYDGSEEAAESLFDRVCGYMHVDRGRLDLCFYNEDQPGASRARRGVRESSQREDGAAGKRVGVGDAATVLGGEHAHVHRRGQVNAPAGAN